jgi:predicted phosphodiesterase
MRCAIISDIHSNREALEAVLSEIDSLGLDAVYCLGDLVGYNADPDFCAHSILSRANALVRGNHDKAAAGLLDLDWFNESARAAVLWTRSAVSAEIMSALKALTEGPLMAAKGILLCHGTPYDEDAYLLDHESMSESFRCLEADWPGTHCCFHGHTHLPLVASRRRGESKIRVHSGHEITELDVHSVYLINPGSVGQPRDGIAMASFGILDTGRMLYTNRRAAYGVRETQKKIVQAGLPHGLARRLAEGR